MTAHSLLPSLPRPRLINIIGATVSEMAPLTLLQAPSGFGKTTMVRQWTLHVEHSPSRELGPLLWAPLYGVSDADSSWSQVALAVGVDPTEAPFPSVCEWATKLDDTHVLIIDNYEEATTPELDRTLVDLVSSAPNLRVILLAQEVSVLRNPLLSAKVRMQVLLDSDLRFSRGEAERLIALAQTQSSAARQRLGQDAAATAIAQFGGWPLGPCAAILEQVNGDLPGTLHAFSEDLWLLLNSANTYLIATGLAICPGMRVPEIGSLLGLAEAESAQVAQTLVNMGIAYCVENEDPLSLYCRAGFVPYLREQADEVWPSTNLKELRRTCALRTASQDPVGALADLISVGANGDADTIAEHYQLAAVRGGSRILDALRQIPPRVLEEHPNLMLLRLILERANPEFPMEAVEELSQRFRRVAIAELKQAPPERTLAATIHVMVAERMNGNWDKAQQLARDGFSQSQELRESHRERELDTGELSQPLVMPFMHATCTALITGDFDLEYDAAKEALDIALAENLLAEQLYPLSILSVAQMWGRDSALAVQYAQQMESVVAQMQKRAGACPTRGNLPKRRASLWTEREPVRVTAAMMTGDMAAAKAALESVTPLINRMEQWPLVALIESEFSLPLAGYHHAHSVLERRLAWKPKTLPVHPYFMDLISSRRATRAMGRGNFDEARDRLDEVKSDIAYQHATRGRLELLEGRFEMALAEATRGLQRKQGPWWELELQLIAAAGARSLAFAQKHHGPLRRSHGSMRSRYRCGP